MKLFVGILGVFCALAMPVYAIEYVDSGGEKTFTITDYIADYVDVPEGATDWQVFGTTKEIQIETTTDDGFDLMYYKPEFSEDLKALDGQEVTVKGYMFPLEGTESQNLFLFGPFPLTCPYQYHVGPSLVIEVHADGNPVKFSYDAVVITGVLELVPDDPEYSVFYRLRKARQVE